MPVYPSEEILQRVIQSFEESGASALLVSPLEQRHPRVFAVQVGGQAVEIWVYIWTLTHGGGYKRPVDEYRIQLTGVEAPLRLNSDGPTLLLGYDANRTVLQASICVNIAPLREDRLRFRFEFPLWTRLSATVLHFREKATMRSPSVFDLTILRSTR